MVKEKTGRAMQTKDRERVNKKTGKVSVVRGSTPIKEGVVVINDDTTMEQLQQFCEVCRKQWGITALQIFIHRDEGYYKYEYLGIICMTDISSVTPGYVYVIKD